MIGFVYCDYFICENFCLSGIFFGSLIFIIVILKWVFSFLGYVVCFLVVVDYGLYFDFSCVLVKELFCDGFGIYINFVVVGFEEVV